MSALNSFRHLWSPPILPSLFALSCRHEYTDTHCVHGDTCANAQCTVGGRHQSLHILSGAVLPLMPVRAAVHGWLRWRAFLRPALQSPYGLLCTLLVAQLLPAPSPHLRSAAPGAAARSQHVGQVSMRGLHLPQVLAKHAQQQPPVRALQSMH